MHTLATKETQFSTKQKTHPAVPLSIHCCSTRYEYTTNTIQSRPRDKLTNSISSSPTPSHLIASQASIYSDSVLHIPWGLTTILSLPQCRHWWWLFHPVCRVHPRTVMVKAVVAMAMTEGGLVLLVLERGMFHSGFMHTKCIVTRSKFKRFLEQSEMVEKPLGVWSNSSSSYALRATAKVSEQLSMALQTYGGSAR